MKHFFEPEPIIFSTGGGEPGLEQDTVKNFHNAISLGADVIRSNTAITKDKKIVMLGNIVFRNREITTSGISSYTVDELRRVYKKFLLDTGSDDSADDSEGVFPELSEVLGTFPHQRFNLHIPEHVPGMAEAFREAVAEEGAVDRILASALSGRDIASIRSAFPDMATSFSFAGILGFYALYRSSLILFSKKFAADALITHERIGASHMANSGLIRYAKERGVRVYVLNVNTENQVRRLCQAGAAGFITNSVDIVKRVIKT
jgi:glycerophosphoryl diester phosphodiesterase